MKKLVFIDTLTTGQNTERCSIYRIGGIVCKETQEGITEIERFDLKSKPFNNARITDAALWTGGETLKSLSTLPEQSKTFEDFIAILDRYADANDPKDKYYLCGFNVSAFDMQFLRRWFLRNENNRFRDYFHVQTIDLMSISAFALMDERKDMPDFHLSTAARFLNIKHEKGQAYDCLANVRTCIKMYIALSRIMKNRMMTEHKTTMTITTNFKR